MNVGIMRLVVCAVLLNCSAVVADAEWPQMRGPGGDGNAAESAKPPTEWGEDKNLVWKTPIPGEGWSTPVVAGSAIWLTTATDEGRSRRVICVDRKSGKVKMDKELFKVPEPAFKHKFNSYASPTPATDGKHVYVTFGTDGTACLDVETGEEIWRRTDINVDHYRGAGSSVVLHGDRCLIHFDGIDEQFIVSLDKKTGKTIWKTNRSHVINKHGDFKKAYSTPIVRTFGGREEILSIAAECIYGYNPEDGKELWRCRFSGFSNAVLPLIWKDRILVNTGFGKAKLLSVKSGGKGDVTGTHVDWQLLKNVPRMSSPIVIGDAVYMVSDEGVASVVDPATGKSGWRERLGSGLGFTASPVYANALVYFVDHKKGAGFVIRPGVTPKIVAKNTLNDGCMASPVIVGGTLILRTKTHLYAFKEK